MHFLFLTTSASSASFRLLSVLLLVLYRVVFLLEFSDALTVALVSCFLSGLLGAAGGGGEGAVVVDDSGVGDGGGRGDDVGDRGGVGVTCGVDGDAMLSSGVVLSQDAGFASGSCAESPNIDRVSTSLSSLLLNSNSAATSHVGTVIHLLGCGVINVESGWLSLQQVGVSLLVWVLCMILPPGTFIVNVGATSESGSCEVCGWSSLSSLLLSTTAVACSRVGALVAAICLIVLSASIGMFFATLTCCRSRAASCCVP